MEYISTDPKVSFVENWFGEPAETQCESKEKHPSHIGVVVISNQETKEDRYLVISTELPVTDIKDVTEFPGSIGFFKISSIAENSLFTSTKTPISTTIYVSVFNYRTTRVTPVWSAQTQERTNSLFFTILEVRPDEFEVHQLKFIGLRGMLSREMGRMIAATKT